MVVHRGSSWDSAAETSHRPSHLNIKTELVDFNSGTSPVYNSNSVQVLSLLDDPQQVAEWKNTFNMRQVILTTLFNGSQKSASHPLLRHPHTPLSRIRGRSVTNAAKSLDILRQNLQSSINKEIDAILKKYLETFFRPAVENVRNNLGQSSVSEEHIREVCRTMLEEAKQMYCGPLSRGSSPFSDCEATSLIDCRLRRTHTQSPLLRKRKESDTELETSQLFRRKKLFVKPLSSLLPLSYRWDPDRIHKDTLFILGSRANKVLGLGHILGKCRLYTKHPKLFKYCGDQQDQDWLAAQKIGPLPISTNKVYFMLLEEIKELACSDEYRISSTVLNQDLKGFEAPDFMLKKMKAYLLNSKPALEDVHSDSVEEESPEGTGNVGVGVECVSSTMTPPATILDSDPSTPSDPLDLLDCPLQGQQSPYLNLQEDFKPSLSTGIADSHTTLSALLASSNQSISCNENSQD